MKKLLWVLLVCSGYAFGGGDVDIDHISGDQLPDQREVSLEKVKAEKRKSWAEKVSEDDIKKAVVSATKKFIGKDDDQSLNLRAKWRKGATQKEKFMFDSLEPEHLEEKFKKKYESKFEELNDKQQAALQTHMADVYEKFKSYRDQGDNISLFALKKESKALYDEEFERKLNSLKLTTQPASDAQSAQKPKPQKPKKTMKERWESFKEGARSFGRRTGAAVSVPVEWVKDKVGIQRQAGPETREARNLKKLDKAKATMSKPFKWMRDKMGLTRDATEPSAGRNVAKWDTLKKKLSFKKSPAEVAQ